MADKKDFDFCNYIRNIEIKEKDLDEDKDLTLRSCNLDSIIVETTIALRYDLSEKQKQIILEKLTNFANYRTDNYLENKNVINWTIKRLASYIAGTKVVTKNTILYLLSEYVGDKNYEKWLKSNKDKLNDNTIKDRSTRDDFINAAEELLVRDCLTYEPQGINKKRLILINYICLLL